MNFAVIGVNKVLFEKTKHFLFEVYLHEAKKKDLTMLCSKVLMEVLRIGGICLYTTLFSYSRKFVKFYGTEKRHGQTLVIKYLLNVGKYPRDYILILMFTSGLSPSF